MSISHLDNGKLYIELVPVRGKHKNTSSNNFTTQTCVKGSHQTYSAKKNVLNNFVNFIGKSLGLQIYLKKDSDTGIFL